MAKSFLGEGADALQSLLAAPLPAEVGSSHPNRHEGGELGRLESVRSVNLFH